MVLTAPRAALEPALVVPDEQTWTLSGIDPASHGLRPVFAVGDARALLMPRMLPGPLDDALQPLLAELAPDADVHTLDLRFPGGAAPPGAHAMSDAEAHPMDDGHDMHGGDHDMHGGHHDMMAIVGDPSEDGLVMEPIELRFGPLGTPFPGGLAVSVTLDGDVVAECTVEALLDPGEPQGAPDPLAPIAWTIAVESAREADAPASPWRRLAALECERAVSHLAWLRGLARILGWQLLVDRCTRALEGLPPLGHELLRREERPGPEDYSTATATAERAGARAERVLALVRRSRLLRVRTAGLASIDAEGAERAGLRGPAARASGLRDDARSGQPLYELLGFEPVIRSDGDAHARALVRAEEAVSSLRLACAALRQAAEGAAADPAEPSGAVEGARGPLRAEQAPDGWRMDAPGSRAALAAAGEAMVGCEWAAALVALASFDPSPWRVEA